MCLIKNQEITDDYNNLDIRFFKVYKILIYNKGEWYTPFTDTIVYSGLFRATGDKDIYDDNYGRGFIHVFHDKNFAQDFRDKYRELLIECYGLKKDFIAAGNHDMVFSKIFIPKKELQRIQK